MTHADCMKLIAELSVFAEKTYIQEKQQKSLWTPALDAQLSQLSTLPGLRTVDAGKSWVYTEMRSALSFLSRTLLVPAKRKNDVGRDYMRFTVVRFYNLREAHLSWLATLGMVKRHGLSKNELLSLTNELRHTREVIAFTGKALKTLGIRF